MAAVGEQMEGESGVVPEFFLENIIAAADGHDLVVPAVQDQNLGVGVREAFRRGRRDSVPEFHFAVELEKGHDRADQLETDQVVSEVFNDFRTSLKPETATTASRQVRGGGRADE